MLATTVALPYMALRCSV